MEMLWPSKWVCRVISHISSSRAWDRLLEDVTRAASCLEVCAGEDWGCVRLNGRGNMGIPGVMGRSMGKKSNTIPLLMK